VSYSDIFFDLLTFSHLYVFSVIDLSDVQIAVIDDSHIRYSKNQPFVYMDQPPVRTKGTILDINSPSNLFSILNHEGIQSGVGLYEPALYAGDKGSITSMHAENDQYGRHLLQ
jgi:hypothetical protein